MPDDVPPKRNGRPPLDPRSPSTSVCVTIPGKLYDAYFAEAQRERITVPELLRRRLREHGRR